ncbi:hypothetical protein D9758_002889 [Tetrapyrgos nigripes]|uniref:Ankyrin repeat protein n=1 Tax=Tetrapyrgos nigripes TaxID=182062 RepID=A0A8H5GPI2_9AGAR|nr:hypothetical protein D9758_002889 [Tetrapyrgos nigripes]
MPAQSHPCLPGDLINKFKSDPQWKTSEIFSKDFESFRLKALKRSKDRASVETEVAITGHNADSDSSNFTLGIRSELLSSLQNFRPGAKKTFLHVALKNADIPLAYEIIRMGIIIDIQDNDGITPLFFALGQLLSLHSVHKAVTHPSFVKPTLRNSTKDIQTALHPDYVKIRKEKIAKITTLLIEQHANLDIGAFGYTPLSLAALAQQWDIVKLMLLHGVRRPEPDSTMLPSVADRIRLSSLMNETKTANPRPPRPCPCWSGKNGFRMSRRGQAALP